MNYNFEWDPVKAASNLKKHGVSFEEAAEVFVDPLQLSILDDTCESEERWITLGNTKLRKLRLVVHTFLVYDDQQVRIVSFQQGEQHDMSRNSIRSHNETRI